MVLLGGRTGLNQRAGDLSGPDEVGVGQPRGGGTPATAGTRGRKARAALKPRTRKEGAASSEGTSQPEGGNWSPGSALASLREPEPECQRAAPSLPRLPGRERKEMVGL